MDVSVVIPVLNEAGNIGPLVDEVVDVLDGRCAYEILVVDDGSTDDTVELLSGLQRLYSALRVIRHARPCGQSLAVRSGVKTAKADVIATLDGDGQNDPRDLPRLLATLRDGALTGDVHLVIGHRRHRRDHWWRRVCSRVANGVRRRLLHDDTPDSGCGIKVFFRDTFLDLPAFHHMHRFLPALFRRAGTEVVSVDVAHRPRRQGATHYGTISRLIAGLIDMIGVMWLMHRQRVPDAKESRSWLKSRSPARKESLVETRLTVKFSGRIRADHADCSEAMPSRRAESWFALSLTRADGPEVHPTGGAFSHPTHADRATGAPS